VSFRGFFPGLLAVFTGRRKESRRQVIGGFRPTEPDAFPGLILYWDRLRREFAEKTGAPVEAVSRTSLAHRPAHGNSVEDRGNGQVKL